MALQDQLTDVSEYIAGRGESNVVDPPSIGTRKLSAYGAKGKSVSPYCGLGSVPISVRHLARGDHSLRVDALDKCRKNVCLGISGSSGQKDVVWVPVNREDSRAKWLLHVL